MTARIFWSARRRSTTGRFHPATRWRRGTSCGSRASPAGTEYANRADAIFAAFAADTARGASAHSHMADALLFASSPSLEIVIAGRSGADDTEALLAEVRSSYLPQAVTLLVEPGAAGDIIRKIAPFTENHVPIDGKAAAYVCRDYACKMPTTDPDELARLLAEATKTPAG